MKNLNLGAGKIKKPGYINIDWDSAYNPDILHNLNEFPYPFSDNYFDVIEASHVMEHLDRPFEIMKELHRLLKPGGTLLIKVPHFSRGFTHSEHCHGFDVTFPMYFDDKFLGSGYTGVEFRLEKMELHWSAFSYLLSNLGYGKLSLLIILFLNKVISFLANLNMHFCSRIWCFWVGGFEELEFKFTCIKN
jgi:SAM-dependent methyltransferase